MNEERRRIANLYLDNIKNENVILPKVLDDTVPVWHIFAIRTSRRSELEQWLKDAEIATNKHYPIPMHLQECYKDLNIKNGQLPIAEEISNTQLSLPMFYGLTDEQVHYVIEKINSFK